MDTPYAEVIGDPIAHSKSPLIHRFWLERLGLGGEYRAVHVRADQLADYFSSRRADPNWRGCNVTVPHKRAVLGFAHRRSVLVDEVRAANTLSPIEDGLMADNTDVAGVLDALEGCDLAPAPEACLLGSGGAALAALAAFRRLSVSQLFLNVRDQDKGRRLLEATGMAGTVAPIDSALGLTSAQLVVNATTLGMTGQTPMPAAVIDCIGRANAHEATIFDMVYAPLETELLRAARARGLTAVDGLAMLIGQAAAAFEIFFGRSAPRQHDAQLRALLTS